MEKEQVSHTAWLVFACHLRLKQMQRWSALVEDGDAAFYEQCYAYCRKHFTRYRYLHYFLPLRQCIALVDKALAFGAPQHFVLRKRAIGAHLRAGIDAGATQVVVMGGGFDTAAFKNAKRYPGVRFFEIDMPAMHGHKTALVDAYLGQRQANLHYISADLSHEKLSDVLAAQPFDKSKPTVFIAEGVMMYLPKAAVEGLFAELASLCEAQATFIFTAIEHRREKDAHKEKKLRDAILKASKERFSWSIDAAAMEPFLRAQGWQQAGQESYADLQRPFRTPGEMERIAKQNGEYLVVASHKGRGA